MKNKYEPLKNKKWLFPETGKAGFHYDDIINAVNGLKQDLRESYAGLHEEELVTQVEKWFPDTIEQKKTTLIDNQETRKATAEEEQLTITAFS